MISFSNRLKKLRQKSEMNQADLAKIIGVARTTIANYEQGLRFPQQKTLLRIANYFNISIDYLLGYDNNHIGTISDEDLCIIQNMNYSVLNKKYIKYMLKGDYQKAYNLITGIVEEGINVTCIFENVFEATFNRLNTLWEKNKVSNAKMLNCATFTETIILQLIPLYMTGDDSTNYTAVSACVNGEEHSLGLQMLNVFMRVNYGKIYYLGENVDTNILLQAIKEFKPDFALISATLDHNWENVLNVIKGISEQYDQLPVIIGGDAIYKNRDRFCNFANVTIAENCTEVLRLANNVTD